MVLHSSAYEDRGGHGTCRHIEEGANLGMCEAVSEVVGIEEPTGLLSTLLPHPIL